MERYLIDLRDESAHAGMHRRDTCGPEGALGMTRRRRRASVRGRAWRALATAAAVAGTMSGCATLQQVAALRSVDFHLGSVSDLRLAGVDVSGVRSAADLGLANGARIAAAAAAGELPLSFRLRVVAENPPDNATTARLIRLQWTLFLEETETVAGLIDREYALPPGQPTDIPVEIALDLFDFFERSGPDLVELALNLAGGGGTPKQVTLRAIPTINTLVGPMRYPEPITIVSRTLGR
jgi:hypothetical protein